MQNWRKLATFTTVAGLVAAIGMAGGMLGRSVASDPGSSSDAFHADFVPQSAAIVTPDESDNVYRPITPCRIVDTRISTAGAFAPNTSRNFVVRGNNAFDVQGGKNGGCGVSPAATAVSLSISAVGPVGNGYLRAWPNGQAEPTASLLNYTGASTTTGQVISLASTASFPLTVKNYAGSTNVVIDVTGYYVGQMEGLVDANAIVVSGSRIISASHNQPGITRVNFDTDISKCAIAVTPQQTREGGYDYAEARLYTSSSALVFTWYINPSSHQESLAFNNFYIHVLC